MTTNTLSQEVATAEWVRVPQAVKLFSLSRSTIYTLIGNGSVASRVVKTRRSNVSGCRLILADSLREFIEKSGQEAATPEGQSA
jgi:hypothetical protein